VSGDPLLRVDHLRKYFPVTAGVLGRPVGAVKAVDDVSFELEAGRTLGLVGESGCGKTTVGECIVRLLEPSDGRILFRGRDITHAPQDELRELRRELQIIFQDPFGSLNPRMTVADIVGEAIEVHGLASGAGVERRVVEVLGRVGIPSAWIGRYPHEFSGGQRQRISIARAIALDPKLVVCDEAVSALDVSIRAQVLNLLVELRRDLGLAYVFISHDLSVVRHIADDVAVMYLGQIVESAPRGELFRSPAHPYARSLLSAIPVPDPSRHSRRIALEGDVPSPLNPPSGCRFHTRCPAAFERCRSEEPPTFGVAGGAHRVKCWHAEGLVDDADWYDRTIARADEAERARRAASGSDRASVVAGAGAPPASRFALSAERAREDASASERSAHAASAVPAPPRGARGRARVELALAGGALVGALAGHPVAATVLALAGFASFASRAETRALRARVSLASFAALALAFATGHALARVSSVREARARLAAVEREVVEWRELTGTLPNTLGELGWRLAAIDDSGRALDPWGRELRFERVDATSGAFALASAGADGAFETADDVELAHAPAASEPEGS